MPVEILQGKKVDFPFVNQPKLWHSQRAEDGLQNSAKTLSPILEISFSVLCFLVQTRHQRSSKVDNESTGKFFFELSSYLFSFTAISQLWIIKGKDENMPPATWSSLARHSWVAGPRHWEHAHRLRSRGPLSGLSSRNLAPAYVSSPIIVH